MSLLLALTLAAGAAREPVPASVRQAYLAAWTSLFSLAYCDKPAEQIEKERLRQDLIASYHQLEDRHGEAAVALRAEWERRVWAGPGVACAGPRGFARARAASARLERLLQR